MLLFLKSLWSKIRSRKRKKALDKIIAITHDGKLHSVRLPEIE